MTEEQRRQQRRARALRGNQLWPVSNAGRKVLCLICRGMASIAVGREDNCHCCPRCGALWPDEAFAWSASLEYREVLPHGR